MTDYGRIGVGILLLILVSIIGLSTPNPVRLDPPPEIEESLLLKALEHDVYKVFSTMECHLSASAVKIANQGATEETIRSQLQWLVQIFPIIVDVSWVSPEGNMVYVEPEAYRGYEGSDIKDQEQIIRLHKTLLPTLSDLFLSVEGFMAMDFEWPVLGDNHFLGSISFLIRPESFWNHVFVSAGAKNQGDNIWLLDKEGTAVYHSIPERIFSNPLTLEWPELADLTREMLDRPYGTRAYEYISEEPRKAFWTHMDLYGTRFVLVYTQKQ